MNMVSVTITAGRISSCRNRAIIIHPKTNFIELLYRLKANMTIKDGLNALRTVLRSINPTAEIDELVLYKFGSKEHMSEYAQEPIVAELKTDEQKSIPEIPLVVKCFIKPEIYAAWHSCADRGNGKFSVSKSSMVDFEENPNEDYKVIHAGENASDDVYIFRNERGIQKFFDAALLVKGRKSAG